MKTRGDGCGGWHLAQRQHDAQVAQLEAAKQGMGEGFGGHGAGDDRRGRVAHSTS
ncbi:hypothetical protein D3C80_2081040 [compost metagenome]